MFFKQKNSLPKLTTGFTLIELLVSIFVMSLITTVVVYNHRDFNDNLEISNLAYAMALSIREIQVSGVAIRGFDDGSGSGTTFGQAYGAYFFIGSGGNNKAFIKFIDLDDDGVYDASPTCPSGECLETIDIGRGNIIENICLRETSGGSLKCSSSLMSPKPNGVNITFLRPRPDAITKFLNPGGNLINGQNDKEAIICLLSPLGRKKSIHILKTGQISVESGDECPSGGVGGGGAQM